MVPACSSGILTNVLPHRNVMPQTQDMTPHPITLYSLWADLSLCYPLMWNVTLEYTTTHFNVLENSDPIGKSFPNLPFISANTQLYNAVMMVVSQKLYIMHTGYISRLEDFRQYGMASDVI